MNIPDKDWAEILDYVEHFEVDNGYWSIKANKKQAQLIRKYLGLSVTYDKSKNYYLVHKGELSDASKARIYKELYEFYALEFHRLVGGVEKLAKNI